MQPRFLLFSSFHGIVVSTAFPTAGLAVWTADTMPTFFLLRYYIPHGSTENNDDYHNSNNICHTCSDSIK